MSVHRAACRPVIACLLRSWARWREAARADTLATAPMRAAVGLSLALALLAPRLPFAQAPPPFSVAVRGGPAQPGSVLELVVHAPEGASDPRGTAFGRPLTFAPGDDRRSWRALVGVDVSQAPGPAPFRIHFASAAGRELASSGTITVAPRTFATRRLRVAGQFVEPPPADVARITAEAARLDDIFTTVTIPERFGPFVPPLGRRARQQLRHAKHLQRRAAGAARRRGLPRRGGHADRRARCRDGSSWPNRCSSPATR